jgi:hypothetical protein
MPGENGDPSGPYGKGKLPLLPTGGSGLPPAPNQMSEERVRQIIREEIAKHHAETAAGRVFGF